MLRARRVWSLCWALAAAAPGAVRAQPSEPLQVYFEAFAKKRLITAQAAEVRELRQQLKEADALAQAGRAEDAALLLIDLTQHPRFADYESLEEMSAAHYALGSALHALGAEPSAQRSLRWVLQKGPRDRYFAPAYRLYVDVALASQPLPLALTELAPFSQQLPEDAQNELYYLQARERLAARDLPAAKAGFERVGPHSRFHGNAQFQLGVLATEERAYSEAEARFCRVARTPDASRESFYVDARYFRIKDLAQLGLGRVAHEQRRGKRAFDYYFRVPQDSPRLPEALFEAAYARYEAKDSETAIDLLDQLEARFPRSPYADEAALLRGYVALAHCQHERALKYFDRFTAHFTPVREEADRILSSPVRREALYEELRAGGASDKQTSAVHKSLLALLRVDPEFNELHERVGQLEREAARAARLPESYELLAARYAGSDRPRPAGAEPAHADLGDLQQELSDLRRALRALSEQLDSMRGLGAKPSELAPLEKDVAALSGRQRELAARLDALRLSRAPGAEPADAASGDDVGKLLTRDAAGARSFERRVLELRPRLREAANARALTALTELRERISGFLRRARIGRIDAVMGSKRKLERQVQSLAAGRFPPELRDPLRVQGFLRDDEEYWPYEGEDWPDEYREDEPEEAER